MEKSNLIPFDSEFLLMIESLMGSDKVSVQHIKESYIVTVDYSEVDEKYLKAVDSTILGKMRERINGVNHGEDMKHIQYSVRYAESNLPIEERAEYAEPNPNMGDVYCRRLMEVRALQVRRDNTYKLNAFVGGGTMTIPRTPDGIAEFSFPTENGVLMDVAEGNYIVRMPDGKYTKMDARTFSETFEPKDFILPNDINEIQIAERMSVLYGDLIHSRIRKLAEECKELLDAIKDGDVDEIMDEMCDVNAVMFHIAHLSGTTQGEMLKSAMRKIEQRQIDPDYMRKHPHTEITCGNCRHFNGQTGYAGKGICMKKQSAVEPEYVACHQHEEKI